MNYGRRQSVRLSKAFASVSIDGTNPADSVVPPMESTSVAPIDNSPKVFSEIDEVPK
jgi:hypothetical protein